MIRAILFDMDGTLLPMDTKQFEKLYFKSLAAKLAPLGYEPQALIQGVWAGTKQMILNDGHQTNYDAFWGKFAELFGDEAVNDVKRFDEYYTKEFIAAKDACGYNATAVQVVRELKAKGYQLILATNPLFPLVGQQSRLSWAGLSTDDFEYVSHYENSHFCKPNPDYYREILAKFNLDANECLMIGNDVDEDMITKDLGMQVFLVTDCLINAHGKDISAYPHGNFDDLAKYLRQIKVL